jgi:addiction module RelE/StbE family toxin
MKNEETLRIEYTVLFKSLLRKAPLEIKIAFKESRELFSDNPNHPSLRNHKLREKYAGFRSIDVTDDWRALFKIHKDKSKITITFHILGTHSQLYSELHK